MKMSCSIQQKKNSLEFKYSIQNHLNEDVFVLDQMPQIIEKKMIFDFRLIYLSHLSGSSAFILQGIDPLPTDRDLLGRMIPYGHLVPAQKQLERVLNLEIPIKEKGTYDGEQGVKSDHVVQVDRLDLEVHYVLASQVVEKKQHAENIFYVRTKVTAFDRKILSCAMRLKKPVDLWKQSGTFHRIRPGSSPQ